MNSELPVSAATAHCRNCGGQELDWITRHMAMAVPEAYPLSGDMAVTACRDCGFVGNHSPTGDAAYADYYTRFNKHQTRTDALHDLDHAYFTGVLDMVEREAGVDWTQTDVLDWGSGALLFSDLASQRGARSAHNYDLTKAYPDLDYGLIASTHCIEHVLAFNAEFRRIHGVLGKDGLFVIAVPDLRGYADVYWGPYAAFDLEHINHFEINSLSDALIRTGFEIVATRESDRLVTPTLAYPEVVILARKVEDVPVRGMISSSRSEPASVLPCYLERSERDMGEMTAAVLDTLKDYESRGLAISPGIYGVASYAFRLIHILATEHDFHCAWIADSDARLTGKQLDQVPIKDFEGFRAWVSQCETAGVRCVVFVAAVNAVRIDAFLKEHFGDSIDICVLPPDCQNRSPAG
ncbi:class I SAM-dependent methyltransferase [Novosphingobium album (ex Hu et al. 2023)]|uniref:Class I SAM-dependent methyltransferase n=1 Tax=Novosphingobium album (ex Hu et al. 2023) TaxID=2930093 RepID=A0ABT0AZE3_9SPHN|nr:class I SAM-dependent methyltransferase [Novosphingobium album (ex Hu et al. 2023)]MCJ2178177.1 class I SAM-dependent methyltransferase [Novosphingobium album (ex Hu et al. 2023)]